MALQAPLKGVRVLEMGQLVAGPFCGQLLGAFGAEVIKLEPPKGGDPLRVWREVDSDGVSPWFRSLGRNKKSVTLDLRTVEGRQIARRLAIKSDVLLENFRPGTLEKWKLGPKDLHPENPGLIYSRISGYGQTGPRSNLPGYASVCEGFGGFRYINGFPDPDTGLLAGAPVRPNISLGDSLAGLHAAFGTVLALLARKNADPSAGRTGQTVDIAIYESVFNMMEGIVSEFDRMGQVRAPSGSSVTGIVPTNAYPTNDPTAFIIIGANGDSIYARLMRAIGRDDLVGPDYAHNHNRVERQPDIERAISSWTKSHSPEQVLEAMASADVPAGRIYNARDIVNDEHYQARGMIESVRVGGAGEDGWDLKVPGVSPLLEVTTGTRHAGPDLGADTREVLQTVLGMPSDEIDALSAAGIV